MGNTYLNFLNSKGNENFRNIVLDKDFKEYQKKLKKLVTLQEQLKNIEETIFGPITKIATFHHLYIYKYFTKLPIMVFDLVNNNVIFYENKRGFTRFEDEKAEICRFNLDKLQLFNEPVLYTMRHLSLEKINKFEQNKKHNNGEFEDDLLERFILLLVSNYQYISFANGDLETAITNYKLLDTLINFSKDNDSIKNETLEEFVKIFSNHIISNKDIVSNLTLGPLTLEAPSLEGLKELFDIENSCLNTSYDRLEKVPNYNFLVDEFLDLSRFVLNYEANLAKE